MSKTVQRKIPSKRKRPDLPLPPKSYRKAISNPTIKYVDQKQAEYELKLVRSFPAEILHRSKNLREPYDINKQMNECIVKALTVFNRTESDFNSSISGQSLTKYNITSDRSLSKKHLAKPKRIISKDQSTEVIISDKQEFKLIEPLTEFPLYRILNDAIGDLAGLMSLNVIKKPIRLSRKLSLRLSTKLSHDDISSITVPEAVSSPSQSQFFPKGFNQYQKGLPSSIGKYLTNKCTLWKIQSKGRPSLQTSLSVNVTSEGHEDTQPEKVPQADEDDAAVQVQPNNLTKLIKVLMRECTAENTIHRILNKWMLPFKISPKDFPNAHLASVREGKYFLQTLTGSDKVMLNKRTAMVKLNHFLISRHLNKVQRRQQYLRDEETKRLRILKIQGLVCKNYDETEKFSDNHKINEKPHIAYNTLRPVFNENPFAANYKTIVKELHADVVLKEKEEEDVASIGEVSFVSSTSSFQKKEFDDDDTLASLKVLLVKEQSRRLTGPTGNQACSNYMNQITGMLKDVDTKDNIKLLYNASENIMNFMKPI